MGTIKMKDIAIYGAGGFGREVACMIEKINTLKNNQWRLVGFFDDNKEIGEEISRFGKVLGGINEINNWINPLDIVLCFGNPDTLYKVKNRISNKNIYFPNLIDPNFYVADPYTFEIGEGNIIKASCSVTCNVTLGNFNVLNGYVNCGHDVKIGNYNCIMPGVRISGEVTIGDYNLLGSDSFIKQQVKIGNNITLSPLSALLSKPKDGNTYIGNPAKIFRF